MSQTKEQIKQVIGTVLLPLMPKRAARLAEEEFSMSTSGRNIIDACLRVGLAQKLLAEKEEKQLADYHRNFWTKENSLPYHRGVRQQVVDAFNEHFIFLLDEINKLTAANPALDTLIEIGAGGGSLLNHLAQNLDGIEHFVGIDLSPEIIEENKELFNDERLRWVADNGKRWVEEHGQANTIYMTFRGVLEYFTNNELREMFGRIATEKSPAVYIGVEPIALDHALATQFDSRPYGTEYTFSHNYPHLLKESGFKVILQTQKAFDNHQICTFIATVGLE